jgi:hypothetical protein
MKTTFILESTAIEMRLLVNGPGIVFPPGMDIRACPILLDWEKKWTSKGKGAKLEGARHRAQGARAYDDGDMAQGPG